MCLPWKKRTKANNVPAYVRACVRDLMMDWLISVGGGVEAMGLARSWLTIGEEATCEDAHLQDYHHLWWWWLWWWWWLLLWFNYLEC